MQNRSQDRSLARAAGKFHASTNGKEEEIATGKAWITNEHFATLPVESKAIV